MFSGLPVLLAFLSLSACGSDSLILPREGEAAALIIVQGDGQTGTVGRVLPESLVVRLTDGVNRPIQHERVVFLEAVTATGAHTRPDTARTDADGRAIVRLVLGTVAGSQTVRARIAGADDGLTVDFHAVASAGTPDTIVAAAGDSQVGVVGQELGEVLVATVADRYGNPVSGVKVSWDVVGGGSVSPATTVSGSDGRLVVSRTLGPVPGEQEAVATASGLKGSPLVFVQHSNQGPPASLVLVSGNNQSGFPDQPLTNPLVVRVLDALGNGVAGAAVTWGVASGGGSLGTAQSTTDAGGTSSTTWILGPTPGVNVAVAGSSGFAVTFSADAGGPAGLEILVQPPASVLSGEVFPQQPSVQLVDGSGNPVAQAGVTCTVSLESGGPSLLGSLSATTTSSGVARLLTSRLPGRAAREPCDSRLRVLAL